MSEDATVGRVLGTDDATPLSFWVAIDPPHSSLWVSGLDRNFVSRVDTGTETATEKPLHTDDAPLGLGVGWEV